MDKLLKEFPCRESQIKLLEQLYGETSEPLPCCVFIYGPPAVGKTSVLLGYFQNTNINYALVNVIECYSHRLLFDSISDQLFGIHEKGDCCDNFMDFTNKLKSLSNMESFRNKTNIIILDGFEHLSGLSDYYFSAFCRLQELTSIYSLSVIFVSHILPEKFNLGYPCITIHFPQYSKDELLQILLLNKPKDFSEKFYKNYLNAALSVFLRTTRDLNEMKSSVSKNFEKYCEPIKRDLVKIDDVSSLWRHIAPHLKASLNTVYLGTGVRNNEKPEAENEVNELVSNKALLAFDLPYYAKYFLIAAYLASYNSPKHDKRLFVKHHGKQKKQLSKKDAKVKLTNSLLGPKAFPLDRLLAIFYSIMEEKAGLTANLMAQISTLVELRLLTKIGDGYLEKPKYKCFVGFQCVEAVAKTLGFNIRKYIMD